LQTFYFGSQASSLYGAYHEPQGISRREGIVLCYPFGQEYMRAHRSFRRLAINLAARGFAVLRFDYRGCGDSAGDVTGVSAQHWIDDIHSAIQELKDVAAVTNVSLMGLRLGGLLAAAAAQNQQINRLVLWDSALSGKAYCDEIRREIQAQSSRSRFVAANGDMYFNGFNLPQSLQTGLQALDLLQMPHLAQMQWSQIVSHEHPDFTRVRDTFASNPRYSYKLAPAPHDWNYVDHVGGILWPAPIVAAIEEYFVQGHEA
jgi:pimeloyl-ACP methyl ester carboxylesterase